MEEYTEDGDRHHVIIELRRTEAMHDRSQQHAEWTSFGHSQCCSWTHGPECKQGAHTYDEMGCGRNLDVSGEGEVCGLRGGEYQLAASSTCACAYTAGPL